MIKKVTTKSEKETFEFAKDFSKSLNGGDIITLQGDLGAGKTIFTKGLAEGLGVKKTVTSPTFVVMKNYRIKDYRIKNQEARIKELVHVDAYRLRSSDDLKAIGIEDYFERDDCVVVVEWPENVKNVLPEKVINIIFGIKKEKRKITIKK